MLLNSFLEKTFAKYLKETKQLISLHDMITFLFQMSINLSLVNNGYFQVFF